MTEPSPKEYHDKADVSARRIAKVYAEALLSAAEKQGQAEQVLAELDSLVRDGKAIMARLPNTRQPEEAYALENLRARGIETLVLPEDVARFSGQGS